MNSNTNNLSSAYEVLDNQFGTRSGMRRYKYYIHRRFYDFLYDLRLGLRANKVADLADKSPRRSVLVATMVVPGREKKLEELIESFKKTRHNIVVDRIKIENRGKLENVNLILHRHDLAEFDYTIVADDDVIIPPRAIDLLIGAAEAFDLDIFQPAHKFYSYSSYLVTERRWSSLARITNFVEVGPITLFRRSVYDSVFPFPKSKYGWGIDHFWPVLASQKGWRMGVVDCVPIRHYRPVGKSYNSAEARQEAAEYLAQNGFIQREKMFITKQIFRDYQGWR